MGKPGGMDDRGQEYEGAAPPDPPASPQARRRVALVIGNSKYDTAVGRLTNPANDARAVAARLQEPQFGFTVTLLYDLGRSAMLQAFNAFYAQASGAEDAVVYYPGTACR